MTPEQKQLAYRIASQLDDLHSLPLHESFVRTYPKDFLESQLQLVLSKPKDSFIINRAAYYNSLVKRNGQKHNRY